MLTKMRICSCQRRETQNTTGLGLEEQGGRGTASSSEKWREEGAAGTTRLSAVLTETPDAEVEWEEKMLTASECASKRGQSSARKSGDAETGGAQER